MSIKTILYLFDGAPEELSGLNIALSLAKVSAAQLRVLHITPPITASMEGIIASAVIVDAIEDDNSERLKKAKEFTIHYCALSHVPLDEIHSPKHHASAKFVHCTDIIDKAVAKEGRVSDIIVVAHRVNGQNNEYGDALVAALFDTGRAVLVTPCIQGSLPREWEHKIVAIAWNGSIEAARALYNAMPFLEEAEKVHVLIARGHNNASHITSENEVMEYLRTHGVAATTTMIDCVKKSTGEDLLAKAHELKADMIVMGAYGHTRAREMIFGGVTHYMLENADIPLLLAH